MPERQRRPEPERDRRPGPPPDRNDRDPLEDVDDIIDDLGEDEQRQEPDRQ